ncbi:MAG: alcohol dehydrogenase catalytic domain-containing protein [Elusimicrobiota bacterium]
MKGLYFSDGTLSLRADLPEPEPRPDEALIKVVKAGICRTDLEIVRGYMGFTGVPGHEFVGIVEKPEGHALSGRRVVGEINCGCGHCSFCQDGMKNHCPGRTVLGIQGKDGAFAERLCLPLENLLPVPDGVSDEEAVFVEPVAAACRITEQLDVRGKKVLVLGDGKLGLLIAQVLSLSEGRVTLCGKHPEKLALLEGTEVSTARLSDLEPGELHDVVVDATGRPEGLPLALAHARPRGQLVLKTTAARPPDIDHNQLVINEITIVGSRCGPFGEGLRLLGTGKLRLAPLVHKTFPLDEGLEAFAEAAEPGALKVLIG